MSFKVRIYPYRLTDALGSQRRSACMKCPFALKSEVYGACCTAMRDTRGMPMNSLGLRRTGRCPA